MNVLDLTPAHVGSFVTLTVPGSEQPDGEGSILVQPTWTISGQLHSVQTDTDDIEIRSLGDAEAETIPGRLTVVVRVGPWVAILSAPSRVDVRFAGGHTPTDRPVNGL